MNKLYYLIPIIAILIIGIYLIIPDNDNMQKSQNIETIKVENYNNSLNLDSVSESALLNTTSETKFSLMGNGKLSLGANSRLIFSSN